jgi:tellurite methyltransferase
LKEFNNFLIEDGTIEWKCGADLSQDTFYIESIPVNYKQYTSSNGIHMFSVFVRKPFISPAPEKEVTSQKWISGELFTYYHDWKIEFCTEDIFDCMSSGIPHKHASNRVLARKM